MFKVCREQERKIEWPVEFMLARSGGAMQKQKFTALFRVLSPEDREELEKECQIEVPEGQVKTLAQQLEENANFFGKIVVGWGKDVVEEDGKTPVEFDVTVLQDLIRGPDGLALSNGLYRAMREIHLGAKEKN